MRSITVGEIATNLNTSRNTVSKVLNSRGYVSEALKRRIVTEAVEKGYKNLRPELLEYYHSLDNTAPSDTRTIAVLASSPEASAFRTQVLASITNAISATPHRLLCHFLTPGQEDNFVLPDLFSRNRVDGAILLNLTRPETVAQIAELPMSKVYLDLPRATIEDEPFYHHSVRGDVVFPEGRCITEQLTASLIHRQNMEKIGFVGHTDSFVSIRERYEGFRHALDKNQVLFDPSVCLLNGRSPHFFYEEELDAFLSGLSALPRAFVCENDQTAYSLDRKLRERFPEKTVVVTGYGNLPPMELAHRRLVTVDINTGLLGKKLLDQLFWRFDHPEFPYETIHLSTKILFRQSGPQA